MPYFIYTLIDPRTKAVTYVGVTNNAARRFKQHINCRSTNDRNKTWIQELRSEHMTPLMRIIETLNDVETAKEREEYWICYYLEQGIHLTNIQHHPSRYHGTYSDFYACSDAYYTPDEAAKILGMGRAIFYKAVEEGKIPYELPPGKKIGMRFPKEAVDILIN